MPNDRETWELLLLRYEIERGDERNERGVFAALVGALIAVLTLTAAFLSEGGELPRWLYLSVPAAPLAILALLAYVMQVSEVRMRDARQLEIELSSRTGNAVPESPARGPRQRWAIRATWLTALLLGLIAIVGVCAVALDRTDDAALQAIFGCLYGLALLGEVAVIVDAQRRRARINRPRTSPPAARETRALSGS